MADDDKRKVKGPNGLTITVPVATAEGLVESASGEYSYADAKKSAQSKK